jgi:hypothetical protein
VDSLSGETAGALQWDSGTKEVIYNSLKTFVVNHPIDTNKYLVHACLEGPEAGVYYRGEGCIPPEKDCIEISLPDYVDKFATDFTVNITPIGKPVLLSSSRVKNGRFTIYRQFIDNNESEFFWHVTGKRADVTVEPYKSDVNIFGDGPYKWYSNKL